MDKISKTYRRANHDAKYNIIIVIGGEPGYNADTKCDK